jgi:2'-hydroxyisoflavone reductase
MSRHERPAPTRRDALRLGALALAGAALSPARLTQAAAPKTLLILGGTGFIGPHLTQAALDHGWEVTHFNRGREASDGVAHVETLIGDRHGQLDALRGRKWDVCIDDTGYIPKYTRMSAQLLSPEVGYCLYISSVSAYASLFGAIDEHSPLAVLDNPDAEEVTMDTYGPMKALCEKYTAESFKGRLCVVRPGYIVGPLDSTDRFTYWPVRAAKGGEMLAPGKPADPIQFVDVRDLTAWIMQLAEHRTRGTFNALSPPGRFNIGDLVSASLKASPDSHPTATWVPEDFLAARWTEQELDLAPWAPSKSETAQYSAAAAQQTGLKCRSMEASVHDTLAWWQSLPAERHAKQRMLLDPQKETDMLKAWHQSESHG